MSEKRFHMNFDKYAHQIMCDCEGLSLQETVKILNGQQATIEELKEENEQLKKEHQEMLEKYVLLKLKIGEVLNDE